MLLCARIIVQINFQISQNTRNWYDIPYFAIYSCHLKGKRVKDNVLLISITLADLEINLDKNSGAKQHKLYYMCCTSVFG